MIVTFCPSGQGPPSMLCLPCHPSLPNKQGSERVLLKQTPGRDRLLSTALLLLWQVLPLLPTSLRAGKQPPEDSTHLSSFQYPLWTRDLDHVVLKNYYIIIFKCCSLINQKTAHHDLTCDFPAVTHTGRGRKWGPRLWRNFLKKDQFAMLSEETKLQEFETMYSSRDPVVFNVSTRITHFTWQLSYYELQQK